MSLDNRHARAILQAGRDKSLRNRHPWVFSRGIKEISGTPKAGDIIPVLSSQGDFLALAFYNPHSQIRLRVLSFRDEAIDKAWLKQRLQAALALRQSLLPKKTDAYRLVNAENDLLPGLIIDYYNQVLVIQCNTLGISRLKPLLMDVLQELLKPQAILERSDSSQGTREGMKPLRQTLSGNIPAPLHILENGLTFEVDPVEGQKTGFFLDQRDNRELVRRYCSKGNRLLNAFSFSGGFSVYAAASGAFTTSVDISRPAIELARKNFELNKLDVTKHQFLVENVFDFLRGVEKDQYDRMVLDPPAFAKQRDQVQKAARGYKDINRLAIERLAPGGILLTCSCSSLVDSDLFQKILFSAAQEANREVQIIGRPSQPVDHPVDIYFPEGEYLKTLVVRVGARAD